MFEFVERQKADHPIATMCRVLGVSASGYHAWCKRPASRRALANEVLTELITTIHAESRGTYGAPRVRAELALGHGLVCSQKRVARLMAAAGLQGAHRRRRRRLTRRDPAAVASPDLVERNFVAAGPDELWVADITYIPTLVGFHYLAVVIDAWSRMVVGWAMAEHLRTELVLGALEMAVFRRNPTEVVHHSDQGCQYTSFAFGHRCREAGVVPSMGSVGDCFDNAMAESFFATLETELLDRVPRFRSRSAAELAIFDFIEAFYNPTRRHSSLDMLSPADYERTHRPSIIVNSREKRPLCDPESDAIEVAGITTPAESPSSSTYP